MKKQAWILIAVTGAFLCLLLGVFIGRNFNKSYINIQGVDTVQSQSSTTQSATSQGKIDINTATVDRLQLLPGIGEALAQRIVNYREENGSFATIEGLMNVSGIGEKKFANIKDYITIGG